MYPASQHDEDMYICSPLELAHQLQFMRFKIWNLRARGDAVHRTTEGLSLWEELVSLGEVSSAWSQSSPLVCDGHLRYHSLLIQSPEIS
jgi:hypothetical protein